MKILVVYYSLEGNAKYVAEQIADITGADMLRLEPVKAYPIGKSSKYIWGGKSVVFGEKPKLKPYRFNKEEYDVIVLGTPVWAGSFTPPLKTFISQNELKGKKLALYTCSAGADVEKCLQKMKKEIGLQEEVPMLSLIEPAKNPSEESRKKIETFCNSLMN